MKRTMAIIIGAALAAALAACSGGTSEDQAAREQRVRDGLARAALVGCNATIVAIQTAAAVRAGGAQLSPEQLAAANAARAGVTAACAIPAGLTLEREAEWAATMQRMAAANAAWDAVSGAAREPGR